METTACNGLLESVWTRCANNLYTQNIIDGLLNVKVSGIGIGLLKVMINGIIRERYVFQEDR